MEEFSKVKNLPNWPTLEDVLREIEEAEDLWDSIEKDMEKIEEEGYEDISDEEKFGREGPPSAINTYPGVPGGCTPIFLIRIPRPKLKKKLWRPDLFYIEVLLEFARWVEGCDRFPSRFVMVVSERKPDDDFIRLPKNLFGEFRELCRWIDLFHTLHDITHLAYSVKELYENTETIVSAGLRHFLHVHWNHYFSWYIKYGKKEKLVYFDGIKIR